MRHGTLAPMSRRLRLRVSPWSNSPRIPAAFLFDVRVVWLHRRIRRLLLRVPRPIPRHRVRRARRWRQRCAPAAVLVLGWCHAWDRWVHLGSGHCRGGCLAVIGAGGCSHLRHWGKGLWGSLGQPGIWEFCQNSCEESLSLDAVDEDSEYISPTTFARQPQTSSWTLTYGEWNFGACI